MARRKGDIVLQKELNSQEDWEEFLSREGVLVIDVFQEWSGPCVSLLNNFKKLRNECSDDLLKFAVAKCNNIESLVEYRGRSKPCFLFYTGGELACVVRGARFPLLRDTIISLLAREHQVLNGEAERLVVTDTELSTLPVIPQPFSQKEDAKAEEVPEYTFALIKPDAVRENRVDEILHLMAEEGIEVMVNEKVQLTDETAREFYNHLAEEPFFEEYIEYMTSGPCHALILTKKNKEPGIILEWRDKLGPVTVEEAQENNAESWRAKFGTSGYMNALHGSADQGSVMRELAFFFPKTAKRIGQVERTLAIIRPDAYALYKEDILDKISEAGFVIGLKREIQMDREDVEMFYNQHMEEDYFEALVDEMTSGPVLALGLARKDAVKTWRDILGPTDIAEAVENQPECLRAKCMVPEIDLNLIHGSQNIEQAENEISFFFPEEENIVVIKPDAMDTQDEICEKIEESGFKIISKVEMVLTEGIIEKMYHNKTSEPYYADLVNYLTSGESLVILLSKEDAILGFRELMGPIDPVEAANINPIFFRAQYGKDLLRNAIHGASTLADVMALKPVFGFKTDNGNNEVLRVE
ncbi:thioredoxin domain-containing protein 3 homolog [Argonauta hians]